MAYYPAKYLAPTVPQNFVSTNRLHSEFFLYGGPRLPVDQDGYDGTNTPLTMVVYSDTIVYELKRVPSFEGELYWSTAISDGQGGYTIFRGRGRLYIAIKNEVSGFLVWKPVVPSHFDSYLDPTTGRTWDPLGAYTCNPSYLCA
jgi:hypothetical protein